jgi:DNA-binding Lrp family transcriptional regulator
MPKSSKKQIGEDEKKFLKIYQINSGDSIEKIAKKCGFSRQKTHRIKKKLEKNKTIWGYPAVLDDEKLGIKRYQILIKRFPVPVSKNLIDLMLDKDMGKQLKKVGVDIDCSFFTHGYFDWTLCITAPDLKVTMRFIDTLKVKFEGCISEVQILEVIFPLLKSGLDNPNISKLREFFTEK